ncbi:MAG: hypothetical protein JKX94_10545 [Sneathiella sp.]|nr:hypothetical protein [Sneathiella sp.]
MGKTLTFMLSLLFAALIIAPVNAQDFGRVFQEAQIENATLSPANEKGISTLRLRLTNLAIGNLIIIGVKGSSHTNSRIMAEFEPDKYVKLDSLSIEAEETLDMADAKIFVQLLDMNIPVKSGDRMELKLVLANGELPFTARIQPRP